MQANKNRGTMVIFASVFALLSGCAAHDSRYRERVPQYDWGFYNASDEILRDVFIDWHVGDTPYREGAGALNSGSGAESSFGFDPIPPSVTLTWRTQDGEKHKREVQVAGVIPDLANFTGIIWLKFTKDGDVAIVPMSKADREQRATHQRSSFPI
jgi:hypothetical protein